MTNIQPGDTVQYSRQGPTLTVQSVGTNHAYCSADDGSCVAVPIRNLKKLDESLSTFTTGDNKRSRRRTGHRASSGAAEETDVLGMVD